MTAPSSERAGGGWDAVERIARVLSVAAIPVVLAAVGWVVQRQLQDQTLRRDYVQIAVALLQQPDTSKVSPAMRSWAIELLNRSAPVPLNETARAALQSGKSTFPTIDPAQQRLLENINAGDADTRIGAFTSLTRNGVAPVVVDSTLSRFEGAQLAALTADGIFNGLSLLDVSKPATWTAAQLARGRAVVARVDSLRAAGDARVGAKNTSMANALRTSIERAGRR